jgi:transcriptional regulator with XRE-family HTH domain
LLRQWRERRHLSQLDLALAAEISTRHLSFVETGRSRPSRGMIVRLTDHLDVPIRERNHILLAAGYAPVYPETALGAPRMASVRAAIHQVLTGHEPYPAVVVDRLWNLVDANASIGVLLAGVRDDLLAPPANALRLSLHPEGMAPRIVNLGEWRAHLLSRARRNLALTGDDTLAELIEEVRGYPCDQPEPELELPGPGDVFVPLRLRHGDAHLAFFSTMTTFGTPMDVTVAELAIESFFPADVATADALRDLATSPPAAHGRPRATAAGPPRS